MERTRRPALGIDLGGTKIATGVFRDDGELLGSLAIRPTLADGEKQGTIDNIFASVEAALASAGLDPTEISGIGLGTTGPLDPRAGKIMEAENLPSLFYFPLAETLEQRFGARVSMSNDGNCFALSEAIFGKGRGEMIVLGVTLGTGCGVGIVISGRILEGASANAGEVYRARVGQYTFDEILSGGGLELLYQERSKKRKSGADITELAQRGDAVALEAFGDFGAWLAKGLGILIAVLDPGVVILGGSVSSSFEYFEQSLQSDLPNYIAPDAFKRMRLEISDRGDAAGARGAAALVFSAGRLDG